MRIIQNTAVICSLLLSAHAFAQYVWLKPVGCATILDIVKVDEEPQFYFGSKFAALAELERVSTPKPPKAEGGADIFSMLASGIPGFGPLVAATVGVISETVINTTINAVRENAIQKPMVDPRWIAYRLTIKPDYGDQFTVIFGVNSLRFGKDSRVQMLKTETDGILNLSFGVRSAGLFASKYVVPQESIFTVDTKKDYLRNCYGDDADQYEAILYRDGRLYSGKIPDDLMRD